MREVNLSRISLIKRPVFTKKTMRLIDLNQYTLEVDEKLTKPTLKKLIENLYNVNVCKVNISRPINKTRRTMMGIGKKSRFKRAIIKLKQGQKLPIFLDS